MRQDIGLIRRLAGAALALMLGAGTVQAQSLDDAMTQAGDTLIQFLAGAAEDGDGVGVLPFQDEKARVACQPFSLRLSDALISTLTTLKRRYSIDKIEIVRSSNPMHTRFAIAGRWGRGQGDQIYYRLELGDVHSERWRVLTIARATGDAGRLSEEVRRCLLRFAPAMKLVTVSAPTLIFQEPDAFGAILGQRSPGEQVWQLARVENEPWVVVQLDPDPLMPLGLQQRRGFMPIMAPDPAPPVAADDGYDGLHAGEAHRLDVLRNDRSEVSGPLRIVSVSPPSGASVSVIDGGLALSFRTDADRAGTVTFRYRMADAEGGEAEAMVRVGTIPRPGPRPGEERTFEGIEFVWVPGGTFEMGCGSWDGDCSNDEKPVHRVTLDGYWLGKYEVTQGEWRRVMGNNPSRFKKGDNHPVEQVSWNDVQDFIRRLNSQSSATFRLPSEAEWEYACRSGGRPEKYAGKEESIWSGPSDVAWYGGNSGSRTHPVGRKSANGLGLHDMSGNVWEWVQDWYAGDAYSSHGSRNPIYTSGGSGRVLRGGSWFNSARYARCANRSHYSPGSRHDHLGFRLLRSS